MTLGDHGLEYDGDSANWHGANTPQNSFNSHSLSFSSSMTKLTEEMYTCGVSGRLHDQRKSKLCWSFAVASVIAAEILRFIDTVKLSKQVKLLV